MLDAANTNSEEKKISSEENVSKNNIEISEETSIDNKQEIEKYCAFDWSALKGCKGKSDDYLGRFLEVSGEGCLVSLGPMAFEG